MTTGGWVFLMIVWGLVIGVVTFCYSRTLGNDEPDEAAE